MAILREEPEAHRFAVAMKQAGGRRLSAGVWIELGAVTSRRGDEHLPALLSRLMTLHRISIEPVTVEQARIGHDAYRRFGKGHHRARLNLGDCFTFALATETGEPLLFKGDDFNHTKLPLAPASAYPGADR